MHFRYKISLITPAFRLEQGYSVLIQLISTDIIALDCFFLDWGIDLNQIQNKCFSVNLNP